MGILIGSNTPIAQQYQSLNDVKPSQSDVAQPLLKLNQLKQAELIGWSSPFRSQGILVNAQGILGDQTELSYPKLQALKPLGG
jgi:hypothetical protein